VKRSLLRALLFVVALIFAGAFIALDDAAAIEIAIDNAKIELVAPTGYCLLDKSSWPESQLVDFTSDGIKRQGERLAYFVDCERVRSGLERGSSKGLGDKDLGDKDRGDKDLAGKDLGEIVDYQASLQLRDQNVTSARLEELCTALRKGDDSSKGWFEIVLETIKGAVKGSYGGAEDSTVTYLVLGYEDQACHVLRFSIRNREKVYTVSALTTIKSKLVTVHVSKKIGNMDLLKGSAGDVIKHLVATSQEAATALIVANQ
jgi:hypothetical protein